MKVGDPWECPHCGKSSFLKKESLMDGWKKVGEVLKCASCGAAVETLPAEKKADAPLEKTSKTDALSALFGGIAVEKKENPLENTERRFCRDCRHRVMNAFRIYCTHHEKDVNPMDDCPDFEKRDV